MSLETEHRSPATSRWSAAESTLLAPPAFVHDGRTVVPVNISKLAMYLTADVAAARVSARTVVHFSTSLFGYPLFDLIPEATRLSLDGTAMSSAQFPLIAPPGNETSVRYLDHAVEAGSSHVLEAEYPLVEIPVEFKNGGVALGLFLNDLIDRGFLERYAPANLEFDQFTMTMEIGVTGTESEHKLFSNGEIRQISAQRWAIDFPDYFTCSSAYVHLSNERFAIATGTFRGQEREIAVTVYGRDEALVTHELGHVIETMQELETDYGPYAHRAMLVFVAATLEPPLAGMEYCGATMTNPGRVVEHELTHSWFGRGVMPAGGNAGWIDEAIARWRDNGYPRAGSAPNRPPVNLAAFSPYKRSTTNLSYQLGSLLLSELDFLLADQGGLKPVLKSLFLEARRTVIDTPFFQRFIEAKTGLAVADIFRRYVYGQSSDANLTSLLDSSFVETEAEIAAADVRRLWNRDQVAEAPRPYTMEELRRLI